MELKGKVHKIGNSETFGNYEKRELVIKTDEQYPQTISVEFGQGKCNEYIDKLQIGQDVTIGVNLRGREWTNQQGETSYFNTIQGWKIKAQDTSKQSPAPIPSAPTTQPQTDNLPF